MRPIVLAAIALAAGAIATVFYLQNEATQARDAQQRLVALQLQVAEAQDIPWGASPEDGGAVSEVRTELTAAEEAIEGALAGLAADRDLPGLPQIDAGLDRTMTALWTIFRHSAAGRSDLAGPASEVAAVQGSKVNLLLRRAGQDFRQDAVSSLAGARWGSAVVIVVLLAGFGGFAVRSARARMRAEELATQNAALLETTKAEAVTDHLTGLRNRRGMAADLAAAAGAAGHDRERMLALFDLDGFKGYNDVFGHPAGDDLLARLGDRLARAMEGVGSAYRMGGDEFCVVAPAGADGVESVARRAVAALTEEGTGFHIGCSYGIALLPSDSADPDVALVIADQRMYDMKAQGRVSSTRQSADVLLRVLAERNSELERHLNGVAELAAITAESLGLDEPEVQRVRLAAQLHDVGKAAIPDAILDKPGPLDAEERHFIERHTVIGERIILAAPSLADVAPLIRSSHERVDGAGYPDGLAAESIPVGARIIAVCDAYEGMISDRPYRPGRAAAEALDELRRCAGSQFDARVVETFCAAATVALQTA